MTTMTNSEIEYRVKIEIIKWAVAHFNNDILNKDEPTKMLPWAWDPTMCSEFLCVGEILTAAGIYKKPNQTINPWLFTPCIERNDISTIPSDALPVFEKMMSCFLTLGWFLGYPANANGNGFKIDDKLKPIFDDLVVLNFCTQSGPLYAWTEKIRSIEDCPLDEQFPWRKKYFGDDEPLEDEKWYYLSQMINSYSANDLS